MAITKIADLVQHSEFAKYVNQQMIAKSALIRSGIAAPDPVIANKVAAGNGLEGKTLALPALSSLDNAADSEVPIEDTAPTFDKVTAVEDVAAVHFRRHTFGVSDVAAIMTGTDPMAHIAAQFADYWNRQNQKILLKTLEGLFAANATAYNADTAPYGNGGDAIFDITGEADSAAVIDKNTIMLAAQLLGDRKAELSGIMMNSVVETVLAGMDTNAGLYRASDAPDVLAKYNGRDIVVDDDCPYDAESKVATIYLFGKGAVAFNPLPVPHPFEYQRDAAKGSDYLHSWVREIIHLRGWKWQGTPSGLAPSNSELATAANWKRVWAKKRIPCVMLKCKLG